MNKFNLLYWWTYYCKALHSWLCGYIQSSKWKFEFTRPNQILEFIFIWFLKKTEKYTGPNKVLLVLGRKIDAHREDSLSGHIFCEFIRVRHLIYCQEIYKHCKNNIVNFKVTHHIVQVITG